MAEAADPHSDENNVRVCVRIRPLLPHEVDLSEVIRATALSDGRTIRVTTAAEGRRKVETAHYQFDHCFDPDSTQLDVFQQSGVEFYCDAAMEGFSSTIVCFGQTGSGKTYTMMGPAEDCAVAVANPQAPDMIPKLGLEYRAAHYMCRAAQALMASEGPGTITLRSSFIEIYNEQVNDLLQDKAGLKVRWSQQAQAFFIEQLMIVTCDSVDDVLAVLAEGNNNRKRASHKLNLDSSRSHVIFTMYVERRAPGGGPPALGKINFVDLAGSERLRDSGSTGVNADETKSINKSLFALGNVISCLASRNENVFVPYRDSNLTRLLMDSLGGGCRTLMVACITPAAIHIETTLSTLKYATRTKNIVNSIPKVRTDAKRQQLFELQSEVELLRAENAQLKAQIAQLTASSGAGKYHNHQQQQMPYGHQLMQPRPSFGMQQQQQYGMQQPPQPFGQQQPLLPRPIIPQQQQFGAGPLSLMQPQSQQQPMIAAPMSLQQQQPSGAAPHQHGSPFSVTSTRTVKKANTPTPYSSASTGDQQQQRQNDNSINHPQQPLWDRRQQHQCAGQLAPLSLQPQPQQAPLSRHSSGLTAGAAAVENPQLRDEIEHLRAMIEEGVNTFSPKKGAAAPRQKMSMPSGNASMWSRHPSGLEPPPPADYPRPPPSSSSTVSTIPLEEYGFRPSVRKPPTRLSVLGAPNPRDFLVTPHSDLMEGTSGSTFSGGPQQGGNRDELESEVAQMKAQLQAAQQEMMRMRNAAAMSSQYGGFQRPAF